MKLVPDFLVLIQTWPRMNLVVSIKVGFGILSPSTILHALLPFFKLQRNQLAANGLIPSHTPSLLSWQDSGFYCIIITLKRPQRTMSGAILLQNRLLEFMDQGGLSTIRIEDEELSKALCV